ncbi:MAG TPA: hypothetical protein EYN76_00715 [Candidatus Marinimicrobia bacterium]|nr:hypothetical protein [Candidatus Neomarinimicrobiota bacterium]
MNEIIITVIVLILFLLVFLFGRKEQVSQAALDKEGFQAEKDSWSKEEIKSHGDIDATRDEMAKLDADPDEGIHLKYIINEWADLKKRVFSERRSWVRNPEKDSE